MKKKAIFFDRDGTINKNYKYVHKISNFVWLKYAVEAIKFAKKNKYLTVVVSNQSGVARNLYSKKDVDNLHYWMSQCLKKKKTKIDKFYYSTYHKNYSKNSNKSYFRKPNPGMIFMAAKELKIDLKKSFMIGDQKSDLLAAKAAKLKFIKKKSNLLTCVKMGINYFNEKKFLEK